MANRTSGRSVARTKSKGSQAKGRTNKAAKQAKETLQPPNNQEVIRKKLEELTSPILDKYGVLAFDEVMKRLETTVKEFTEEVSTLFDEMVSRSREDHERMKSLLTEDEGNELQPEEELENEEDMSEVEKRLEHREQKKASQANADEGE